MCFWPNFSPEEADCVARNVVIFIQIWWISNQRRFQFFWSHFLSPTLHHEKSIVVQRRKVFVSSHFCRRLSKLKPQNSILNAKVFTSGEHAENQTNKWPRKHLLNRPLGKYSLRSLENLLMVCWVVHDSVVLLAGSVKLVVRYSPHILEEMEARFERQRQARKPQQ